MKKTNKIILISTLVSLLLLGIGYAAIQNISLTILGFAEVGAKAENFKVKFLDQINISKNGFDHVVVDAQKTGDVTSTINLSGLSKAGETISAVYTIVNESKDLSADLTVATTNDAPEYLTISSRLEKTSLLAGEQTTVEVIVKVTKTPITDNIKAKIGVELIAMPVQPGEEGTSEGIKDFDQTPNSDERNEYGFYYDRFYCNEELGYGLIAHADYSAESFELWKAEEHEGLTEDEWFCSYYWGPGENNIDEGFELGARVEDEGKTIVNPDGTILTLSDKNPHGIHIGNKYTIINGNGAKNTLILLEDRKSIAVNTYKEDGELDGESILEDFFTPKANGYIFEFLENVLISFNVTGDIAYITENQQFVYLDTIHNYRSQVMKQATCTEKGLMKFECVDCNNYYMLNIPILNHKKDKNCNGICSDCGAVIEYDEISYSLSAWALIVGDKHEMNPTEVIIPEYVFFELMGYWCKVTEIYYNTFEEATNLRSVVIPKSIIKIQSKAFEGCENLETIYYQGTKEQWEQIIIEEGNERLNDVTINFNYEIPKE